MDPRWVSFDSARRAELNGTTWSSLGQLWPEIWLPRGPRSRRWGGGSPFGAWRQWGLIFFQNSNSTWSRTPPWMPDENGKLLWSKWKKSNQILFSVFLMFSSCSRNRRSCTQVNKSRLPPSFLIWCIENKANSALQWAESNDIYLQKEEFILRKMVIKSISMIIPNSFSLPLIIFKVSPHQYFLINFCLA